MFNEFLFFYKIRQPQYEQNQVPSISTKVPDEYVPQKPQINQNQIQNDTYATFNYSGRIEQPKSSQQTAYKIVVKMYHFGNKSSVNLEFLQLFGRCNLKSHMQIELELINTVEVRIKHFPAQLYHHLFQNNNTISITQITIIQLINQTSDQNTILFLLLNHHLRAVHQNIIIYLLQ